MPANITWYVKDKAILISAYGDINAETMHDSMLHAVSLVEQSNELLVHTVVDVRATKDISMRLKERVDAVRPLLSHQRCGWIIMVGQANPVANFVASTAAQIFKARFRSFKTPEEGLVFLKNVTNNLPQLPPLPDPVETNSQS